MPLGSFSAGLSGLNANAAYLGVIGNNLANVNTIGFKASAVTFSDLVSQSAAGTSKNPTQVGLGVTTRSIAPIFSQGSIESTQSPTNLAIQGNGFFVVNGTNGRGFTRAGDFSLDSTGKLVTPDGAFVQGYTTIDPLTGAVVTTGQPTDILIPPGTLHKPVATTQVKATVNFDAAAAVGATFSSSMQVFDALGASHVITMTFTKTSANTWTSAATVPGAEVAGGVAGTPFVLASGAMTLAFDNTGKLATINGAVPTDRTITTPAWTNGAAASTIVWDLWDPTTTTATLTGFAAASSTSSLSQNGSAAGVMASMNVDPDGKIMASFGSGQTVAIGQVAIASFNNPQGLIKLGSNYYGESPSSGSANIGVANTGARGSIIGSALEQSNVDVAQQFTQMILAQRGYQANAKTITVSDELMQDTLGLKR